MLENKNLLKECLTYLLDELKLSSNFFANQIGKDVTLESIYLLGGSSKLNGLCEILEEETGIVTKIFNPIDAFVVGEGLDLKKIETFSGSLSVPLGLAIRE